ncbi:MAG: SPOR domain-containing protein [Gammaproteobacteria bacterium]|nr:SPOR domain-containing protein [Gammaproteobacteria bacterium]
MPDSEQPSEINQLRAFEMRMQTEGAAGFANGPEPWNNWREPDSTDDQRVWGCDREREDTRAGKTQCEKLLTGMATVAVATLAVGIGGVYLSSSQPVPQVALDTGQPAANVAMLEQAAAPSPAGSVIRATAENVPSADTGATEQEIVTAIAMSGAADNIIGNLAPPATPLPASGTTSSIQAPAVIASADRLPQNPGGQAPADITAGLPAPAAGTPATAANDTPAKVSMVTPPVSSKAASEGDAEGIWVVNISSYNYQSMARRKLQEFKDKGVIAEVHPVTINGKPMYRIRATGYESRKEAKTWLSLLQDRLGVDSAWVSKR